VTLVKSRHLCAAPDGARHDPAPDGALHADAGFGAKHVRLLGVGKGAVSVTLSAASQSGSGRAQGARQIEPQLQTGWRRSVGRAAQAQVDERRCRVSTMVRNRAFPLTTVCQNTSKVVVAPWLRIPSWKRRNAERSARTLRGF
jgi:hypothetical protein